MWLLLACKAPFTLVGAQALWVTDPSSDAEEGGAVLFIGTSKVDCVALSDQDFYQEFNPTLIEGQGLIFLLSYDSWGETVHGSSFEGMWMSGKGFKPSTTGGSSRSLEVLTFQEGYYFYPEDANNNILGQAWLEIEKEEGSIKGRFSADPWGRAFSAEDCGVWMVATEGDDTASE
jgi:hypothetical protein